MSFVNIPHRASSPPPAPRMRRRGSSIAYFVSEASGSSTLPFSSADAYQCPICKTMLTTTSPSVFDDHVDHCSISRTISSSLMKRRSSSTSVFSDSGCSDDDATATASTSSATGRTGRFLPGGIYATSSIIAPATARILDQEFDDARFTISANGDAVEFGGFGRGEPLEASGEDLYTASRPRAAARRRTTLISRTTLRRRLAVDLHAEAEAFSSGSRL